MLKLRKFITSKAGILLPRSADSQPKGVPCGYCPYMIFKKNEAGGRLYLFKEKPICVKCRILLDPRMKTRIRSNLKNFLSDKKGIEKFKQHKENERVRGLALESQIRTNDL